MSPSEVGILMRHLSLENTSAYSKRKEKNIIRITLFSSLLLTDVEWLPPHRGQLTLLGSECLAHILSFAF